LHGKPRPHAATADDNDMHPVIRPHFQLKVQVSRPRLVAVA
jgi:hypothetical protein